MQNEWALAVAGVLAIPWASTIGGCSLGGDDDDDGGAYACSYEQRRTDGCDGVGWEDWVSECVPFNADDYYITPAEVCANLTESGLYCEAGCCIDYEHRNVDLRSGSCY